MNAIHNANMEKDYQKNLKITHFQLLPEDAQKYISQVNPSTEEKFWRKLENYNASLEIKKQTISNVSSVVEKAII